MSRLTYRTDNGFVGVNNLEDKTVSPTSVAIHKLADIEDFFEELGFDNLQDLKNQMDYLDGFSHSLITEKDILVKKIKKLNNKIYELEAKLAEREEAIKYLKGIKRYDIGDMLTENAKLKQQLAEERKIICNQARVDIRSLFNSYASSLIDYCIWNKNADENYKLYNNFKRVINDRLVKVLDLFDKRIDFIFK